MTQGWYAYNILVDFDILYIAKLLYYKLKSWVGTKDDSCIKEHKRT